MVYHIRYPKIENKPVLADTLIITEKIDGANLGIGFVNGELLIQSRSQIRDKDDEFMKINIISENLISIIEKIKDVLEDNFLVYGEIFGQGVLPNMKYDDSEVSLKVFGSSIVHFRAFDILKIKENVFMKYSDAIDIFESVGLPYVPILNIVYSTIDELYALVETYKSAYSALPVEGFILKKDEEERKNPRTIFKIKRKIFKENSGSLKKYQPKNYVNGNRIKSAYSKHGNNREEVEQEIIQDVLNDIMAVFKNKLPITVENFLKQYPQNKEEQPKEICNDKFQIETYVYKASLEIATKFKKMKEEIINDVLKEIKSVYRQEVETIVHTFLDKKYDRFVKYKMSS